MSQSAKERPKTANRPHATLLLHRIGFRWVCAALCLFSALSAAAQDEADEGLPPVPTHLEFVEGWFPRDADSALYAQVVQAHRLATRMNGDEAQFESILAPLELIKATAGFDPTRIDRFTMARISTGDSGTVIFFSLFEPNPLRKHFASGGSPIQPEVHQFLNLPVYKLDLGDQNYGLFSADGKHFILGDWGAFKKTLVGNNGRTNELVKILAKNSAPIVVCSNPRKSTVRHANDLVFGSVMSFEFQEELLAFMLEEEHATPASAEERLKVMRDDMPDAFADAYDLRDKVGTRFIAKADGRFATFALQAPIKDSRGLLEDLLGPAKPFDPYGDATLLASEVVKLYHAARSAQAITNPPVSIDKLLALLCEGVDCPQGKHFILPFTTAVERERIIERLELVGGEDLRVVEQEAESVNASKLSEKQVRRHARLLATLSMSAAAADSSDLKKLKSAKDIVAALSGEGLRGGTGYERELYKGPELSLADQARVTSFLAVEDGQLVYRSR